MFFHTIFLYYFGGSSFILSYSIFNEAHYHACIVFTHIWFKYLDLAIQMVLLVLKKPNQSFHSNLKLFFRIHQFSVIFTKLEFETNFVAIFLQNEVVQFEFPTKNKINFLVFQFSELLLQCSYYKTGSIIKESNQFWTLRGRYILLAVEIFIKILDEKVVLTWRSIWASSHCFLFILHENFSLWFLIYFYFAMIFSAVFLKVLLFCPKLQFKAQTSTYWTIPE